jgi:hypothetical protein
MKIRLIRSAFILNRGQCKGTPQRPFDVEVPDDEGQRLVAKGRAIALEQYDEPTKPVRRRRPRRQVDSLDS